MIDDHSPKLDGDIESPAQESVNSGSAATDPVPNRESTQTEPAAAAHLPRNGNVKVEEPDGTASAPASEDLQSVPEQFSQPQPSSAKTLRIDFTAGLQSLLVTVIIALFIITFIVQAFQIPSESMENTLLVGDYLLVDKTQYGRPGSWSWLFPYRDIHRDDVVVFHPPMKPEMYYVKRVVAVPGDHVRLQSGKLYVNEVLQEESFAIHRTQTPDDYRDDFPNGKRFNASINPMWWRKLPSYVDQGELIVPRGCYFALGDNRDDSSDSRYWGFVPRENVVGRPLIIYFSHAVSHPIPESQQAGVGDKLASLVSNLENLARSVRWKRALRVIH